MNAEEQDPKRLIDSFCEQYGGKYTASELEELRAAWDYLLSKTGALVRADGKPFCLHPLRTAEILADKGFDATTVVACFFHSILDVAPDCYDELERRFGRDVASICRSTSKITNLKINSTSLHQADSIRKMLFAMIDDIRVIFVKLADRLDRMRNLDSAGTEERRTVSKEVLDIWCPLAGRLGMSDVKNEMEDLSLKYTNPAAFQQIKTIVAQKKKERADYLDAAVRKIYSATEKAGISVTISSRAKHFYSIYQKMRKRNVEAGDLYDLLAIRIICGTTPECYTLLGIVHSIWKPMEGQFNDYIAMPKSNGYQSLHTTVICEGKPLEIQIRTREMHEVAEHGVASHWLYKKGTNRDMVRPEDLSIINQLRALRDEDLSDETFFAELKDELLGDSIYVFTPKGDVKELPQGANAIDFAYAIHSGVGEKVVGAKADGRIIPLTQPLENTQIIEILTNPAAHPTQSQLKSVKTSRARQKIHAWLVENDPTFVDKDAEEKRAAEVLANTLHSKRVAERRREERKKKAAADAATPANYTGSVRVEGSANFVVTIAKCCKPAPGDLIVGYISRKRGVTVHRADCLTYLRIPNIDARSVSVAWDTEGKKKKRSGAADEKTRARAKRKQAEKNQYRRQR